MTLEIEIYGLKEKVEYLDKLTQRIENKMKTTTVITTTKMASTSFPTKPMSTTPTSVHVSPVNEYYQNLLEALDDMKFWTIIIAVGIIFIITIKAMSMCRKVYKIHNEQIIMKARTSPDF